MALKKFRTYATNQSFILPPNPEDWLAEDHVVFFLRDLIKRVDLSTFLDDYDEGAGAPPFHPRMMVGVLMYAYARGVRSSRKIAMLLENDVGFRVLSGNQQPDFRTVSDFRKRHLKSFEDLFTQVLLLCQEAGLVKLGHVSVDGTQVKANASKRKAMSLKGLREEEQRLREEVRRMLREAEDVDAKEDQEFGDQRGDELPPELRDRKQRLEKIEQARQRLEQRERDLIGQTKHRQRHRALREPRDSAQWNFTDPDSRIMADSANRGAFLQGYNCQLAVDAEAQVIVAYTVEQTGIDNLVLPRVVERLEANVGLPREMSLDAGYNAERNLELLAEKGVDAYVSMRKHKRDFIAESAAEASHRWSKPLGRAMAKKIATQRGKWKYGLRKRTVEPVFGQVKEGLGFRRFSLRGLGKVTGEWGLVCAVHNALKLSRAVVG